MDAMHQSAFLAPYLSKKPRRTIRSRIGFRDAEIHHLRIIVPYDVRECVESGPAKFVGIGTLDGIDSFFRQRLRAGKDEFQYHAESRPVWNRPALHGCSYRISPSSESFRCGCDNRASFDNEGASRPLRDGNA